MKKIISIVLLLISITGLILIGTEIYLNLKRASLCQTEGCAIVHILDKYNTLGYLGFFIFLYLFLVSLLDILNFHLGLFLKLRTYLLSLSVIVEGYLIGLQTWVLNTYCQYCLFVASLLFLAFFLDYFYSKKRENTSIYKISFLSSISVFLVTYLVNLSLKPLNFKSPIIVYKKDCIHCKEVISYAKEKNIEVKLYEIKDVLPLARIININSVPILLSKEDGRIVIINGKEEIKKWFDAKYGIKEEAEKDLRKAYKIVKKKEHKQRVQLFYPLESNKTVNNTEENGVCTIEKPCQ
jgi:glutaredoxin